MTLDEILLLWANSNLIKRECLDIIAECNTALKTLYGTIKSSGAAEKLGTSGGKTATLDLAVLRAMEEKEKYSRIAQQANDGLQTTLYFSQIVSRVVDENARAFEADIFREKIRTGLSWSQISASRKRSSRTCRRVYARLCQAVEKELKSQDLI